jgi:hypothetical protein
VSRICPATDRENLQTATGFRVKKMRRGYDR